MIAWQRQGGAVVGSVTLANGKGGRAVIVGGRDNPKGALLIAPGLVEVEMRPVPLREHLDALPAPQLIEVLCMQERVFGEAPLPPPDVL